MPRLIDHLDGLYVSTLERVELLRCACAASAPDPAQLSSARLGLMAVSAKRSRFLHDEVYPLLIAASVAAFGARVQELEADLSRKRAITSQHISHWSLPAIRADWPGYRRAVARITKGVEDRVAEEKAFILPALEAVTAMQALRKEDAA